MRTHSLLLCSIVAAFCCLKGTFGEELEVRRTEPLNLLELKARRTEPLNLLDQLFPNMTLDAAFERFSLLSRAESSSSEATYCVNNSIPTAYIPSNDKKALSREERLDFAESLMTPDILGSIVDRYKQVGGYVYGDDYKLKKRQGNVSIDYFENVTEAKEKRLESWEQCKDIVDKGYSLIADGLHMIWSPIARMARMLEQESGCNYATCNLYYTPANNAGFEPHYDWMDVVVVQVAGIKKWSVASEPSVYLSNQYQTRYREKPTAPRYEEFIMNPGDVLYIPRGFTHNATTPLESEEPSLHLTFGIEHQWFTTFEALIHHAINLYASGDVKGFTITPSEEDCDDMKWTDHLHYTISELARIEGLDAADIMRQSVPRNEAWKQLHALRHSVNGTTPSFEESFTQDYNEILDNILEFANASETKTFFKELRYLRVHKDGNYGYVGIDEDNVEESVACFLDAEVDELEFNATVKEFVTFAKENQAAAMESLERKQARKLFTKRMDDNFWLKTKWGNTDECDDKFPLQIRYRDDTKDCQQ